MVVYTMGHAEPPTKNGPESSPAHRISGEKQPVTKSTHNQPPCYDAAQYPCSVCVALQAFVLVQPINRRWIRGLMPDLHPPAGVADARPVVQLTLTGRICSHDNSEKGQGR